MRVNTNLGSVTNGLLVRSHVRRRKHPSLPIIQLPTPPHVVLLGDDRDEGSLVQTELLRTLGFVCIQSHDLWLGEGGVMTPFSIITHVHAERSVCVSE